MSTKEKWAIIVYILPFGSVAVGLSIALALMAPAVFSIYTIAWTAALFVAFFLLGLVGKWLPKTEYNVDYKKGLKNPEGPVYKFCEGYEKGWIKQPIAVWSDLAFVVAGLIAVLWAGTRTDAPTNPMVDPENVTPLAYGIVVIFMGPASMFFHASMKEWAGWFDNLSIVIWAAFSLSYTVARLAVVGLGWSMWPLWVLFGIIVVGLAILTWFSEKSHTYTQIGTAGAFVLLELIVMIIIWCDGNPGFERSTGWFIASLGAFAAAFLCWIPSGAVFNWWCDKDSALQGHGFWHLFAAMGTLFVYLYFASEVPM